jgi:hypothetical protein
MGTNHPFARVLHAEYGMHIKRDTKMRTAHGSPTKPPVETTFAAVTESASS